ncbi:hypothetical protein [Thiocapsa sp. N5-Cardenillas]|uniref:hypothetical protein n=1 Tax=Thiocapsa sp. N5-Cardenillas TaxID=3137397 RepID=UPI0035B40429
MLNPFVLAIAIENAAKIIASRVAVQVVVDLVREQNQPWTYYTGLAAGTGVALATSNIRSVATFYTVAKAVDLLVLKSPEGGLIKAFVGGVETAVIDTFNESPSWQTVSILLAPEIWNRINQFDLVNEAHPTQAGAFGYFALGDIIVTAPDDTPGELIPFGDDLMAYNTLTFRIADAESDTRTQSVAVYLPAGLTLAQYQAYADVIAPEIDELTEGQISGIEMTVGLTVPAGLKESPVATSYNERGGLITFDTSGPRAESVRIPAMSRTIMTGDEFSLSQTDVAALITRLTTNTDLSGTNVRPRTSQDYQFSAARAGKKSLRK